MGRAGMIAKLLSAWFCQRLLIIASVVVTLIIVAEVLSTAAYAGDEIFASVGTGQVNGIYYPVAKDICRIVNRDLHTQGVRCSPESTPGSVYNIDALQSGELELGIVQSDVQFAAYNGEGAWKGRPFRGLRSVASLYPELVTIIARAASHKDRQSALTRPAASLVRSPGR